MALGCDVKTDLHVFSAYTFQKAILHLNKELDVEYRKSNNCLVKKSAQPFVEQISPTNLKDIKLPPHKNIPYPHPCSRQRIQQPCFYVHIYFFMCAMPVFTVLTHVSIHPL